MSGASPPPPPAARFHLPRCILAACLAALLLGFSPGARAGNTQAPFVTWLTQTLPQNGYTVIPGSFEAFPGCPAIIAQFGTCFGNNAATPYLLPQPPEESPNLLPPYAQSPGFTGSAMYNGQTIPTNILWQLNTNEAIVTVVTLPPQAAYFGYQSYLAERSGAYYVPGYQPAPSCPGGTVVSGYTLAPDCNFTIFGGFFNTVNNADVLNIAGLPSWNSWTNGAPTTNNTIAIITTPNQALAGAISALFSGSQSALFNEEIPVYTKAGTPGGQNLFACSGAIATPCDEFISIIRVTLPQSLPNNQIWQSQANVLVYRVTGPTLHPPLSDLYDSGSVYALLHSQGCNTNETLAANAPCASASPNLAADLADIAGLLQQWMQAQPPLAADTIIASEVPPTAKSAERQRRRPGSDHHRTQHRRRDAG
jgi:hypothetical protein